MIGGDYEDEFQAALFGNAALCRYDPGRMVIASLRFQTHESQGGYYQDTVANEIVAL